MIKVLNLYAGIGGNRKLWEDVEVTAVEINPKIAKIYQEFFPDDKMIVTDAHQYLLAHHEEFDFIWSSPPCPTHSRMVKFTRHKIVKYADMSLYQEIIFLKHFYGGKWVVENVEPYYEPLIKPKKVGRHFFWSNFPIPEFKLARPDDFTRAKKDVMMKWLDMQFEENIYIGGNHDPVQVLRNCVHPKLGLHVLNYAFKEKQQLLEVGK